MREILFRGKEITSGEWICGYYNGRHIVQWHDNEIETFPGTKTIKTQTMIDVIPETVGQYTGLTDKNGKKIFEGDILKSTKAWYTVEFASGGYGLKPFGKGKLIPLMGHWNFTESEVEVIGNIHDTPELLEVEK